MKSLKQRLEDLNDVIRIQNGEEGSSYMIGLYNGLVLAKSILILDDPVFKDIPKHLWIKDKIRRIKYLFVKPKLETIDERQ